MVGAFTPRNALGAFSLLPMLEAMRMSFNKSVANLGFLVAVPDANVIGLLTPYPYGWRARRRIRRRPDPRAG